MYNAALTIQEQLEYKEIEKGVVFDEEAGRFRVSYVFNAISSFLIDQVIFTSAFIAKA